MSVSQGLAELSAESEWEGWTWHTWAERLLDHYFARTPGEADLEAILHLDVSSQELARVAGCQTADSAEVQQALIDKVVGAAEVNGLPFWSHAVRWSRHETPFFIAHLIVACIAVSDVGDSDESSNIDRIAAIARTASGDLYLESLPELWRQLQEWLQEHSDDYRQLVLPDPGGWTRIGYTVRLAFPGRNDCRKLGEVLSRSGNDVVDPPIGPVLQAVRSDVSRFSGRFRDEFNYFCERRLGGASSFQLFELPFWSAVRCAVSGTGQAGDVATADTWTLVMEDDVYDVELMLVGTVGVSDIDTELLEGYGDWCRVASSQQKDMVCALLDGELSVGRLGLLVQSGILPFREELHGALELADRQTLDQSRVALVHEELVEAVIARFGGRAQPSPYARWQVLRDAHLSQIEIDESDSLARAQLTIGLSPRPRRVDLVRGVRVENAWLGLAELLPRLKAPDARKVVIVPRAIDGSAVELEHGDDEFWHLPFADLWGPYEIVVDYEDGSSRRDVDFVQSPDSEMFRSPSRPEAWVVEGFAGAIRLNAFDGTSSSEYAEPIGATERLLLGRNIGIFVTSLANAAWEITRFGDKTSVRCLTSALEVTPEAASTSGRDKRLWRRLLDRSDNSALNLNETAALRRVLASRAPVPGCEPEMSPAWSAAAGRPVSPKLQRVMAGLVGISNRRQGLDRRELSSLLQEVLRVDVDEVAQIIRAWIETGVLDEATYTRWSGRRLFAVAPVIDAFKVDNEWRAAIRGLCLDSTRDELRDVATDLGIEVSAVQSFSEYVPAIQLLRCADVDQLKTLGDRQHLRFRFLSDDPFAEHVQTRDLSVLPPSGYVRTDWVVNITPAVCIARWRRRGSPGYWTVERGTEVVTWTHFYDSARFWACHIAGVPVVEPTGDRELAVVGAHLPLSVARLVTALGGVLPGPSQSRRQYIYDLPSQESRDFVLAGVERRARQRVAELFRNPGED